MQTKEELDTFVTGINGDIFSYLRKSFSVSGETGAGAITPR